MDAVVLVVILLLMLSIVVTALWIIGVAVGGSKQG